MTTPPFNISDDEFAGLLAIVDRHAGKEHRADGSVAAALREVIEAAAPLIAVQVLRSGVVVDSDDLTTVLNQRVGHAHSRPGIWDDDNRPGLAGTRCVECAARERLHAALRESGRGETTSAAD